MQQTFQISKGNKQEKQGKEKEETTTYPVINIK